jgi:hypothetical protein
VCKVFAALKLVGDFGFGMVKLRAYGAGECGVLEAGFVKFERSRREKDFCGMTTL